MWKHIRQSNYWLWCLQVDLRNRGQGLCGSAYVRIITGGGVSKSKYVWKCMCKDNHWWCYHQVEGQSTRPVWRCICQGNHWWWCHQFEGQSVRPVWQVVCQGNHWWWCLQVEGQVIRFTRPQIQSSVDVSPSHSYVFWKTVFLQLSFIFCSIKVNFYNTYGWKECVQINPPPLHPPN